MQTYLEHANITVPDVDAAIAFLRTLDPTLGVRNDGTGENGRRWVHVGNDRAYIALQAAHPAPAPKDPHETYVNHGINHLGWVVADHDAVVKRLDEAGYRRGMEAEPHPHRKRAYYYDSAGLEWEILEYLSSDPAEFNDYKQ